MTLTHLHDIRNFPDLFTDRRLVAALTFLRENHPEKDGASADHWRGWFDALAALEKLAEQPKLKTDPRLSVPYSGPSETNK